MNVFFAKFVDRYFGGLLCVILSPFKKSKIDSVRKILFVQLWGIGETVCTLPAIKASRKKFQKAKISVLATDRNAAVYKGQRFIDDLIVLKPGLFALLMFAMTHRKFYDLVIDMEEYLNISSIVSFFVGKNSVGFSDQLRSRLYTNVVPYDDSLHVTNAFMALLSPFGVHSKVKALEPLMISKDSQEEAAMLLKACRISPRDLLVGIAVGTAESSVCRKWPRENFAKLADFLVENYHARIVFVGTKNEVVQIVEIIGLMRNKALNLGGKTSVHGLFALMKRFNLFVGNDSGPMHIAAAQCVPTIGLFGPNLKQRFGPLGKNCYGIYKGQICEYSPCINVHLGQVPDCRFKKESPSYQKCMKNIAVNDVIKVIREVLAR